MLRAGKRVDVPKGATKGLQVEAFVATSDSEKLVKDSVEEHLLITSSGVSLEDSTFSAGASSSAGELPLDIHW